MASASMLSNGNGIHTAPTSPLHVPEHDLVRFVDVANKVADAAGEIIRKYFRNKFEILDKDDSSPVTIADQSAEETMVSIISEKFPSHAIYGEEKGWRSREKRADYVWVLDPIDGTKSFITGKPLFGTLIALLQNGRPILGIIDQPVLRERWIGISGKGTTLNGQQVSTRTCATLSQAYMYTTSPHLFSGDAEEAFIRVRSKVKIPLYGCDCYAYALLASGFVDLVIESGLKPYDFLALIPVIEGAGGVITDWKGHPLSWEASPSSLPRSFNVVAAGDKQIHQQALDSLQWKFDMEKRGKKHSNLRLHQHHHHHSFLSSMASPTTLLIFIFLAFSFSLTPASSQPASSTFTFIPKDNILIDCGADTPYNLPDGRRFKSDPESNSFLKATDELKATDTQALVTSPIYTSCRIFMQEAKYSFHISQPGFHWLRLHFFPVKTDVFDLQKATFSVTTDKYVLLHNFNFNNNDKPILKEYLLNITEEKITLTFSPLKNSAAFINGIELVSAPDRLIFDTGSALFPVGEFSGLSNYAFQAIHRLNNGGPLITPTNDTLGRTWVPDQPFLTHQELAKTASVATNVIKFPQNTPTISPLIAPHTVYASVSEMGDAQVNTPNFNVSWKFDVDTSFSYLIRLHFCDIVSKGLNELYFNVFVNEKMAIPNLDLSAITGALAVPYYKDIVVNASLMSDGLTIQIGPAQADGGNANAILNGIEVMKMSNSVDSLDGEFGVDGQKEGGSNRGTVAAVGFAMMFGAFVGLGAMVVKWHKRPQDWQKRNSFSSWLLPLHAGDNSFSKNSMGSHKSMFNSSTMGLGRYFSFAELQEATKNWDNSVIIGVGGFGNVYLAVIDDGTQVAVKRGNPNSEQGITEFQTEIQMLSKLRHRHLVSLIGYCDENDEMILVYEYMANGPFRDHLYGKNLPPLSWKQRLEISIGAARGLHYLHTGTNQGIIHRDVKTTNILLDENFTAKVSDFGLSKDAPMGQGHVSTAVKGSFGYLDPEYFRRQQLTDKSDVYSFGVVLLEVLCARAPLNPQLPREQVNLADWAMQWKRKGLLDKIIDPALVGTINPESMKKFAEAAEKCLADYGVDRPSMGDVLWNLEYALQLQDAFTQGKSEDETKPCPTPTTPTPPSLPPTVPTTSESQPSPRPEINVNPSVENKPIEDHSGTAMFAQFANLSGR
ncbi:putative receptor-like protein kinase [Senna tora]|uniref:histidinol-phosphatase n=1 Tax=Senna tora TaxID=362788 RepID=A0A834SXQ7_9FABA|nr:putative receptor-like protein kinase [Senna tora]